MKILVLMYMCINIYFNSFLKSHAKVWAKLAALHLEVRTKVRFAVSLINNKLTIGSPFVSHIKAAKDGDEPIKFDLDVVLTKYYND